MAEQVTAPVAPLVAPKEEVAVKPAADDNRRKWALEQSRIDNLPVDQRAVAQAKLHADMAEANKDVKPLSLSLSPDEYVGRVKAEREASLVAEEKAMKERHKAEGEALARRQKAEAEDLADARKRLDAEMKAIHAHVELWRRQDEEVSADPSRRDHLMRRYDQERVAVANETGYEVRRPTVGDTTITGFQDTPLPGHPWIRPVGIGSPARLHPEI